MNISLPVKSCQHNIIIFSVLSCNAKVLKLQAAIKYGEEDLQGAKVSNRPFYSCVLSVLAWIKSEAVVDLVLIETSLLFLCK